MTFLTRIQEQIVPVTIAVVICAIGFFSFTRMPALGTAGDVIVWIMLLVAFCVLFSFFPAIAIIYGWYTGNRAGAILAGALPLPLLSITVYSLFRANNMVFIHHDTIIFILILSAICGFAGFCAAQRTKPFLAVSVVLNGFWLFFWMNAFN
ncbi:MAG: hypothetical protein WC593_00465 [Methanoregula sp.]